MSRRKGSRGRGGRTRGGSRSSKYKGNGENSPGRNKKNTYKKRGRGGRGGFTGQDSRSYSELHDLENPDFVSVNMPQNSMRASAARASRNRRMRLQDEVFQTENNIENTMKLPLRKRPVEFVKASLYDPSHDLLKRLSEKTKIEIVQPVIVEDIKVDDDHISVDVEIQEIQETHEPKPLSKELKKQIKSDLDDILISSDESDNESEVVGTKDSHKHKKSVCEPKAQPSPKKPKLEQIPDDQLFFVDDEGETDLQSVREVFVEPPKPKPVPLAGTNLEYDPSFSVGKVLLTTTMNSKGEMFTSLPKKTKKNNNLKNFNANASIYELDDDEDIYENNTSKNLYKSYDEYLQNVMDNLHADDEDTDEDNDGEGIFDELDEDFEEEAKFIASAQGQDKEASKYNYEDLEFDSDGNDGYDAMSITAATVGNLTIDSDSEIKNEKTKEPEYGFLPEDYESFDNSLLETIKIRYGSSSNKYFLKCFQMTGTYEFEWIDQDDFEDFLLENGMPEHRLMAYLKFIEKQITPEELSENAFDLPISDSSDEDEEDYGRGDIDSDSGGDEDGLEDLIMFTQKYDGLRDMEIEPTHGLKTRGKKRKELILDHIDDEDLRKSLQAQFDIRYENKKAKKKIWDQNVAKEHQNSQDLSLKYPYTLHIKEIRTEFDSFYQDRNRNSLAFPPMDPHGIKTIQKIAYYYNMLSRKFGSGHKSHVVVIKNKRTFRCHPDHHSVNQLMRQRPVFNRIDQKRPKAEVEYEQGKSSRRGNPSKAHVKEGDIVGGDAPEIASNNIGRLLLMKMGWSTGQGLGLENKGIAEPVVAKVKKTKLGIR